MRLILTITMLVVVVSAVALGQPKGKAKGVSAISSSEREILKSEEEYRQAALRLDAAAPDRIFDDDLMSVAPVGVCDDRESAVTRAGSSSARNK